jgi:hydrogenase-4 component B
VGAVAICGLPPLNGFVSELFVYLGLIRSGIDPAGGSAAVMAAPVLAMIGALAVACFVKVYGAVFLGIARTSASGFAHESPLSMRIPMVVLAVVCGLIGLAPWWVSPILDQVIAPWLPATGAASLKLSSLVPLKMISGLTTLLLAFIGGLWLLLPLVGRARREAGTWDCGYAQPTSRMQYTAASFAQTIVVLFHWVLRPRTHQARVEGLFPKSAAMQSHVDDAILDRVLLPSVHGLEHWFGWFHRFQRGFTQYYILYILITVILMLSTLLPFKEIFALLL